MDYENPRNFERLTGQAIFFPTDSNGDTAQGGIDLGNIVMHKVDYGIERKEVFRARGGKKSIAREDAISSKPVWEIQGNEFLHEILPFILLGDRLSDAVQNVTTNATLAIAAADAAEGKTYDFGQLGLTAAVVLYGTTVANITATAGVDYVLDQPKGLLRIPLGSPLDGNLISVSYNAGTTTRSEFAAFTKLNRQGNLKIFEEDEFSTEPKSIVNCPCTLSCDEKGDVSADDFSQFTLKATVTGEMTVSKRQDA